MQRSSRRGNEAESYPVPVHKNWELQGSSSPQVIWATGQMTSFAGKVRRNRLHPDGGSATVG
jgi:hypothetical protein